MVNGYLSTRMLPTVAVAGMSRGAAPNGIACDP